MKYIFTFFLLFLPFWVFAASTVSESCSYKPKLDECLEANKNLSNWSRTITDFICISSQNEWKILAQIVLDTEFKEVDKKVESYLRFLEDNKDYYFKDKNFLEAIDDIESKFSTTWEFWKQYLSLCKVWDNKDSILAKTVACFPNWIATNNTEDLFQESTCNNLAVTKMEIDKQVAYDLLKLNKEQVRRDEHKLFVQWQRTKFGKLLKIVMVNLWYVERIRKKTPSLDRNPY